MQYNSRGQRIKSRYSLFIIHSNGGTEKKPVWTFSKEREKEKQNSNSEHTEKSTFSFQFVCQ